MDPNEVQQTDTDNSLLVDIADTNSLIANLLAECKQAESELAEYLDWLENDELQTLIESLDIE